MSGRSVVGGAVVLVLGASLLGTPAVATTEGTPGDDGTATGTVTGPTETLAFIVEDLTFTSEDVVFGSENLSGGVKEEGSTITLAGEVLFDPNVHTLSAESGAELELLIQQIKDRDASELTVIGHTDNVQGKAHNQQLSERRATTIAEALQEALGADVKIKSSGKGQDEPIADNATDEGKELNRRVEVTVVK